VKERDLHLLARAAREAARAEWLFTAPNPRVGALALSGGQVVGYGHHARLGEAHAEEAALRDAGAWDEEKSAAIPGVVDEMVLTLEPCSARGGGKVRPACADLLRAAGIRRLVVGARDPDPRHQGAALRALAEAGVEVVLLELPQEDLLDAFHRGLAATDRPFVLLKWAASLDGKVAAATGVSQWISGPSAREEVHQLRALTGAILCGAGTLLQDDAQLTARPGGEAAARQPLRVLLDAPADLPATARVLTGAGPRLWVTDAKGGAPAAAPPEDQCLRLPRSADGRLRLAPLLEELRRRGVRHLLVEGGPTLHGSFLDQQLADAVVRYEAPLLLGGPRSACSGRGVAEPALGLRLRREERRDLGPDLRRAFLLS